MSSAANADEVVEIADDGVTVRKSFAADEFPVLAIRFELESDHDGPVSVRLSERIPDEFPMDSVGFHPDYHSDCWTAFQDNHVEFSGTVEPDEPLVTVYGIRVDDESRAGEFLTEPTIDDVTPKGTAPTESETESEPVEDTMIDDIVSEDRNQVVKDMISGEADSVPGLEESEGGDVEAAEAAEAGDETDADDLDLNLEDVDTDPVETDDGETGDTDEAPDIDLDFDEESVSTGSDGSDSAESDTSADEPKIELDLDAAAEATKAAADEGLPEATDDEPSGSDATDPETDEPEVLDRSIGSRLAAEIRNGRLADDDLAALRDELGVDTSGSDLVKVEHLQRRVEEVAAYSNALEEFLDEEGTGAALIEELQKRLTSFESDLGAVTDRLEGTESQIDAVEGTVDAIDSRVDTVESDLETIETDVSEHDRTFTDVKREVSELDDGLGAVADDVVDVAENLDGLEADVDHLEDGVDDLEDGVDDLEEDVANVCDDVAEIQEWRSELGSMFSGES